MDIKAEKLHLIEQLAKLEGDQRYTKLPVRASSWL